MNPQNVLKKILVEVQKETPDISYIRGMLEVLIEQEEEIPDVYDKGLIKPLVFDGAIAQIGRALPEPMNHNVIGRQEKVAGSTPAGSIDEASILNAKAKAHIERFGMPKQND